MCQVVSMSNIFVDEKRTVRTFTKNTMPMGDLLQIVGTIENTKRNGKWEQTVESTNRHFYSPVETDNRQFRSTILFARRILTNDPEISRDFT
jgi:hypothetical protein